MSCWICGQKADYRKEKKQKALLEAKQKAIENEQTMAIWKEGCIWQIGTIAESTGKSSVQFVSWN